MNKYLFAFADLYFFKDLGSLINLIDLKIEDFFASTIYMRSDGRGDGVVGAPPLGVNSSFDGFPKINLIMGL